MNDLDASLMRIVTQSLLLESVTVGSLVAFAVIGSRAIRHRTFMRLVVVDVGAIVIITLLLAHNEARIGNALVASATLLYAIARRFGIWGGRRTWLTEAALNPLVLAPPFVGTWWVAAGGPDPGRNHHLVASDQRFAYDFIRSDGPTLDSLILSPVAGRVVAVCDGRPDHRPSSRPINDSEPLGNHVAIDTGRGVVFLCHLRNGSVSVRDGALVEIGKPLGRCGNNGRTTRPHLHIHAQDLQSFALDRAIGLPVVFRSLQGHQITMPPAIHSTDRPTIRRRQRREARDATLDPASNAKRTAASLLSGHRMKLRKLWQSLHER